MGGTTPSSFGSLRSAAAERAWAGKFTPGLDDWAIFRPPSALFPQVRGRPVKKCSREDSNLHELPH